MAKLPRHRTRRCECPLRHRQHKPNQCSDADLLTLAPVEGLTGERVLCRGCLVAVLQAAVPTRIEPREREEPCPTTT